MESHRPAQCRQLYAHQVADLIDRSLVVAGRFDFDQLANIRNHQVAPLSKIRETTLRLDRIVSPSSGRHGFSCAARHPDVVGFSTRETLQIPASFLVSSSRHPSTLQRALQYNLRSELIDDEYDD